METTITTTSNEQQRAWVLTRVLKHELTMTEAAEAIGLSERQLWRLRVAFELDGSIVAFDGARQLAVRAAPAEPVQLRAQGRLRPDPGLVPGAATLPWTPPADHPWRRVKKGTRLYQQRLTESLNS